MRLGINLPYRDFDGRPLDVVGIAQRAAMVEEAGFDAIWQPDSLAPEAQPRPDALIWLAVAATATRRVLLGTAVYIAPFRNALELTQRALSMHLISGGRFALGVGAGSDVHAYAAAGLDFEGRFKQLHRTMGTVRALGRGEHADGAFLDPWPEVHGGPPLLLGAWHSDISLRRAVRDYDGWICSAARTSLNVMRDGLARYRDMGGTRAVVASCPVDLRAVSGPLDPDGPFTLKCPPEEAAERLQMLVDLGFDDVGLQKIDPTGVAKRWEADYSADDLAEIRALLPR